MIPETFNSTVNYLYLTKGGLELFLTVIGVFFGAFFAFLLEERSRRKWNLFVKSNEKIYQPWLFELKAGYEFKRIKFDLARAEPKIGYVIPSIFPGAPFHIKCLIEEIEIIFGRNEWLKKHVKKNVLEDWEDFKKNFSDYEKECASFFEKIKQTATKRVQLPFDANSKLVKDNKCIAPSLIEHIYNKLIMKESGEEEPHYKGSPWYKGIKPSIEKLDSGIYKLCWEPSSGDSDFYAQGSEEEMENCKNIFKELVNYSRCITKAERLIKQAKEIEEIIKLLKNKIGELMDLEKL